jgi:hypothetical protein
VVRSGELPAEYSQRLVDFQSRVFNASSNLAAVSGQTDVVIMVILANLGPASCSSLHRAVRRRQGDLGLISTVLGRDMWGLVVGDKIVMVSERHKIC